MKWFFLHTCTCTQHVWVKERNSSLKIACNFVTIEKKSNTNDTNNN